MTYDTNGISAESVAIADVNGDGKPDIVVANYRDLACGWGGVGVLLGNGDGTFQTAVDYCSGGSAAYSVAVADVNGDGKPDIVVANANDVNVGVLLGNGDGTFQAAVTYSTTDSNPISVAVADVNGDGKLDIVVADGCGNADCTVGAVGVLLGNGDGTFQTAVVYDSGGWFTVSVAVADVNGDGKPDIIVANADSDNVGVLLGNGDGTFQTPVSYDSGGSSPESVVIEDVNGDNKPDIVVANSCEKGDCTVGSVGVLLGNGDGTFQAPVAYGSGGYDPVSVAIADVNGDGNSDILVTNCSTSTSPQGGCIGQGTVGVLLGNGGGTFQSVTTYDSGGYLTDSVAVLDVNGNGKPDVVVVSACADDSCSGTDATVGVLINTSLGSTTIALTSSPNPSNVGQAVTFTATVTPSQFFKFQFTGTVTFTYGSTTLCNGVTLVGGVATCTYSTLPAGTDIVTASYSGDANFAPSSVSVGQTVNQASTTLTLVSSPNPSGLDSPVTFTATITPQYGGHASGTVTFKDGSTPLGSGGVSGNVASLTTSGLAIGTHSITAVYSGDPNFTGSTSNTLSQVVTKATTTTTLLSSINPSVQGKPVTFTAVVSSLAGTPTGKIKYLNGATVLATLTLTSSSAKYTTSKLPPGANSITAVYGGDSNNDSSTSAPVNQFVLAATTTTLTSSPNPSAYGQGVAFTARVGSSIGFPPDGETVTFRKGTTVLATVMLSGGSARFTTSTLKVGTTAVTAAYGGDSNFSGSTSKAVSQVVSKATTTTTLVSSQNPSNFGQSVTFKASVTPQFSGTVTGTVTFYDGTTVLKTVALSGGVAKFTTSTLTSGAHSITATYNGSTSFTGSSASLTQTVN